jgi:type I restriction-modification system DNA methylase subunit
MFVQSAAFVEQHRKSVTDISIYGQEKVAETTLLLTRSDPLAFD